MKKTKQAVKVAEFIIAVGLGAVILLSPVESASSVRESLSFTVSTVIPSLFPFMVISRLITASDITKKLTIAAQPTSLKLFNLRYEALTAVLLGFISGFPIGAVTVCESYRAGRLNKKEAERAVALAHNTGPSFPIGLVGAVLWGSKALGVALYVIQLLSWVIIAALYKGNAYAKNSYSFAVDGKRQEGFASIITGAVCSSATACVSIAGFTAFMHLCSEVLVSLLPKMSFYAFAAVASLFEFSDGCSKAALLGGTAGCAITAFAISFGGLSALLQGASAATAQGLSVKPLLCVKLAQGVISSLLATVYFSFFCPVNIKPVSAEVITFTDGRIEFFLLSAIFLLFIILKMFSKRIKRH